MPRLTGDHLGRAFWFVLIAIAFGVGFVAGGVARQGQPLVQEIDRLEKKVETLQARLRARDDLSADRPSTATVSAVSPRASSSRESSSSSRDAQRSTDRIAGAMLMEQALIAASSPPQRQGTAQGDRLAATQSGSRAPVSPTVQAALDRFYRYLEATNGVDGRERWQRTRELIDELRSMGPAGSRALMHVLAAGNDTEERRTAARLLGNLQVPQSLPMLRDIIDKDSDVLLRRAAASSIRQLQTPESLPVMERLLTNPNEDRFVRISAAYGLAQSGKPVGVTGLTQIFEESTADGRGRDVAFRALNSLQDERSLPFMRQVVASQAEPSYRLQAIRFVTAQGDQQAIPALQAVMNAPNEQPSIREAAAQAYATIIAKPR